MGGGGVVTNPIPNLPPLNGREPAAQHPRRANPSIKPVRSGFSPTIFLSTLSA